GADGGGIPWAAAGLGTPALRRGGHTPTVRAVAFLAAGIVALGLALVGLDALTGGSSHVTSAVDSGPGGLVDDWLRRLHISYRSVTSDRLTTVLWIAAVAGLAAIARARPRVAVLDALLVAIAVSLLFN